MADKVKVDLNQIERLRVLRDKNRAAMEQEKLEAAAAAAWKADRAAVNAEAAKFEKENFHAGMARIAAMALELKGRRLPKATAARLKEIQLRNEVMAEAARLQREAEEAQ